MQSQKFWVKRLIHLILFDRPWLRLTILISAFFGALFGILGPLFQRIFIDKLLGAESQTIQSMQLPDAFAHFSEMHLLGLAFASFLLSLVLISLTSYLGSYESNLSQRKLSQLLYDKVLDLRSDSLNGRPVGDLVSVYATDVPGATILLEQTIPVGAGIIFPIVIAPLAMIYVLHTPAWPTIAAIATVFSVSLFMAFRQSFFFLRFKNLAAERIGLVNEWIQNIRTLRILGWITPYEKKIFHTREIETQNRIAMVTNGQSMNAMSSSVTYFLNLSAVSAIVYMSDQPVSPGTLVALLWIIAIFLTRPFRQLPWVIMFIFDGLTSIKRIAGVMQLENSDPNARDSYFHKLDPLPTQKDRLSIRDLNLNINGSQILRNISLDLPLGKMISIVGEVGCGKTSLLLSLIGESGASFETYKLGGIDARKLPLEQLRQFFTFVPQEGFIMSASLRENVAFQYGINNEQDTRIQNCLRLAQFDQSQEHLEDGLDTEIGERGVNLSGGQRQRVSLARVNFYRSPIILLDDCLSAVDVRTEESLMRDLINGEWKDHTRILTTHRLSILQHSHLVIFMKDGMIQGAGKYAALLAQNEEFRNYAATVTSAAVNNSADGHRSANASLEASIEADLLATSESIADESRGYGEK